MSPSFAPASMSAAITSVYAVIASCTPWMVVSRSSTICEIDTFMTLLSRTITNWAEAKMAIGSPRPRRAPASWLAALMAGMRRPSRNTYGHGGADAQTRPLWPPAARGPAVADRPGDRQPECRAAGHRDRARRHHAPAGPSRRPPVAPGHADCVGARDCRAGRVHREGDRRRHRRGRGALDERRADRARTARDRRGAGPRSARDRFGARAVALRRAVALHADRHGLRLRV